MVGVGVAGRGVGAGEGDSVGSGVGVEVAVSVGAGDAVVVGVGEPSPGGGVGVLAGPAGDGVPVGVVAEGVGVFTGPLPFAKGVWVGVASSRAAATSLVRTPKSSRPAPPDWSCDRSCGRRDWPCGAGAVGVAMNPSAGNPVHADTASATIGTPSSAAYLRRERNARFMGMEGSNPPANGTSGDRRSTASRDA